MKHRDSTLKVRRHTAGIVFSVFVCFYYEKTKNKRSGTLRTEYNDVHFRQHLHLCCYYIWHDTADGYESLVSSRGEKVLVGGITGGDFKTLRGDKTQSFITKSEVYN